MSKHASSCTIAQGAGSCTATGPLTPGALVAFLAGGNSSTCNYNFYGFLRVSASCK